MTPYITNFNSNRKRKEIEDDQTGSEPNKRQKQSTLEVYAKGKGQETNAEVEVVERTENPQESDEAMRDTQGTVTQAPPQAAPQTADKDHETVQEAVNNKEKDEDECEDFDIDAAIEENNKTTIMFLADPSKKKYSLKELTEESRKLTGFEMAWSNLSESRFYLKFNTEENREEAEITLGIHNDNNDETEEGFDRNPLFEGLTSRNYAETEKASKLIMHVGENQVSHGSVKQALDEWLTNTGHASEAEKTWVEPNATKTVWYLYGMSKEACNLMIKEARLDVGDKGFAVTAVMGGRYKLMGWDKNFLPSAAHARRILKQMTIAPEGDIYINREQNTLAPARFAFFNIEVPAEFADKPHVYQKVVEAADFKTESKLYKKTYVFKVRKVTKQRGNKPNAERKTPTGNKTPAGGKTPQVSEWDMPDQVQTSRNASKRGSGWQTPVPNNNNNAKTSSPGNNDKGEQVTGAASEAQEQTQ